MASRPPNGIADLLRASSTLDVDGARLRQVAVLLGLAVSADEPAHVVERPTPAPMPEPAGPSPARRAVPRAETDAVVRPAAQDPRRPRDTRLVRTELPDRRAPRPVRGTVDELLPRVTAAPLPPPSLFESAHERAVLTALVALNRPGQEPDVQALIDLAAARAPFARLPVLTEPTTRLGVRLVVDHGPSMAPFRRDLRLLEQALRHTVGVTAVDVLAIWDDPRTGLPLSTVDDDGPHEDGEEPAELPFAPATGVRPILVASDLGIGAPGRAARPDQWLAALDSARHTGCPVVALVPYPPARWPLWAVGRLPMVHWDRPTRAGQARDAARRASAPLHRRSPR